MLYNVQATPLFLRTTLPGIKNPSPWPPADSGIPLKMDIAEEFKNGKSFLKNLNELKLLRFI